MIPSPPGTPRFLNTRSSASYWSISRLGIVVISTFSVILLFVAFSRVDSHSSTALSTSSRTRKPSYRLFNSTDPVPSSRFAIATLLTGQDADDDVGYFESVRLLGYQLLHAPDTRIRNSSITWVVACSPSVPTAQKAQLHSEGALVIEVDDVPIPWWVESVEDRWKETFTKLRFFEMTEFSRLVFLDGDHMIMSQLDSIFAEPEATISDPPLTSRIVGDEGPLPDQWVFAGRAENSNHEHPVPPEHETGLLYLNSGFFMVKPDQMIFDHLMTVMSHAHRFDPLFPDQNLLNYVYRRDGPMPWRELDWKWNMNFPTERDADAGVATLHEKWWMDGPQPLRDVWEARRAEMNAHFQNVGDEENEV